jgi:hypothetical protein
MIACTDGNGTFTITFQSELDSTNNVATLISDYSSNIIFVSVTRINPGVYNIVFLTNTNLNSCQLPTFSAQVTLPVGSTETAPTVVGSNYSVNFDETAYCYPWTVEYVVNTNVDTASMDVNATYTLQLVWPTKAPFGAVNFFYLQILAQILSAAAASVVAVCGGTGTIMGTAGSTGGGTGTGTGTIMGTAGSTGGGTGTGTIMGTAGSTGGGTGTGTITGTAGSG